MENRPNNAKRIVLRESGQKPFFLEEYRPAHIPRLFAILDAEIGENLGWEVKNSAEDLRKYLENQNLKFWSMFLGDEIIGGIFLDVTIKETNVWERRTANLGYFVERPWRGKGYVSFAVPPVISYAFDVLKLQRLKAGHLENNGASRKIIEKNGFRLVGIERNYAKPKSLGKYLDHYLYDLIPNERRS